MTMRRRLRALLSAVLVGCATAAGAENFGTWTAICETAETCRAETGGDIRIAVEPVDAGWLVALVYRGAIADPDRPLNLTFANGPEIVFRPADAMGEFHEVGRYYVTDPDIAVRLFNALGAADTATLSLIDITGEPVTADFALGGIDAALEWLTAARNSRAGPQGAAASDPPVALDRSEADAIRAAGIPEPVAYIHLARSDCEDPASSGLSGIDAIIEPLTGTSILYALPCVASGDNVAYRLYVRERGEIGGVSTQLFALWSDEYGWSGTDLLYNVTVDGSALTAHFKGRNVTDCGWAGRWTFVDYAYRLERFALQEQCSDTDPAAWPAIYGPAQ